MAPWAGPAEADDTALGLLAIAIIDNRRTERPRAKGAKKAGFWCNFFFCNVGFWLKRLPCSRFLERNAKTLFWTILKFGHFGVKLDHFELNWP